MRVSGFCRFIVFSFVVLCTIVLIQVSCFAEPIQLRLQVGSFDPCSNLSPSLAIPNGTETLFSAPRDTRYYIVQCSDPILSEWTAGLEQAGATILDYIPDFAYLVRVQTPSALTSIKKLSFVRWVGPYLPAYKIQKGLLDKTGSIDLTVALHSGEDASQIVSYAANTVESVDESGWRKIVRMHGDKNMIMSLASQDAVVAVQEHSPVYLKNNVARGIMNVPTFSQDLGMYGAGQIIGVCDTGLDVDSTSLSTDFSGRLLSAFGWTNGDPVSGTYDWSDTNGHGTHVIGSLLGTGVLSGSNPALHNYTGSFAGVAPEASLVLQASAVTNGALTGIPDDLSSLFQQAYNQGARIHSNSWGGSSQQVYDSMTRSLDAFCWAHPDMLVLIAAGNDGADNSSSGVISLGSIDPPATAKDCIAVGASESLRPTGGLAQYTYGYEWSYPAPPISTDLISNNSSGMAAWSSRGPTADGRIKPDIVAPGTDIISDRSHSVAGNPNNWSWGVYDSNYVYMGGTSMSTPQAAGACALIREYLVNNQSISDPSAALIKATLLNGAFDMYPGQYGAGQHQEEPSLRPNMVEGWGRVDVANSVGLISSRQVKYVDNTGGLTTNGSATYTYTFGSAAPIHITLVWTDYPAATTAAVDLVNDLDLTVTGPTGTVYLGNGHVDRINNVESVDIANPIAGVYTFRVSGYNVPQSPQPFALVVSGATYSNILLAGLAADGGIWYTTDLGTWHNIPGYLSSMVVGNFLGTGIYGISGIASDKSIWYTNNLSTWTKIPGSLTALVAGDFNGSGKDGLAGLAADGSIWYTTNLTTWTNVPGVLDQIVTADFAGTGKYGIGGLAADSSIWYTTDLSTWNNISGKLSQIVTGSFAAGANRQIAGLASDSSTWYTYNLVNWVTSGGNLSSIVSGDFEAKGHDDIGGIAPDGSVWYAPTLNSWVNIPGFLQHIVSGHFNTVSPTQSGLAGIDADGGIWYTTNLTSWTNIPGKLASIYSR